MRGEELGLSIIFIVIVAAIVAGTCLMIAAMVNRWKMREMIHRERLAMIQAGMIPSPESDPAAFERRTGLVRSESAAAVRFRASGIILIGIGLGLMVLISFAAGAPAVGFGVGAAWVALGGALLLNYFLISRNDSGAYPPDPWTPPQARPPQPPVDTP